MSSGRAAVFLPAAPGPVPGRPPGYGVNATSAQAFGDGSLRFASDAHGGASERNEGTAAVLLAAGPALRQPGGRRGYHHDREGADS